MSTTTNTTLTELLNLPPRARPYMSTFDSFKDITKSIEESNIPQEKIQTFVFRHPILGAQYAGGNNSSESAQPNDLKKVSIKTMAEYILNFGLTLDDADMEPISVTTDQEFKRIYYSDGSDVSFFANPDDYNNRPATIKHVMDEIEDKVIDPMLKMIFPDSAETPDILTTINEIKPDYILSLDPYLQIDKLLNITGCAYEEVFFNDFLFIGDPGGFTPETVDGLYASKNLKILVSHNHGAGDNIFNKPKNGTPILTVKGRAGYSFGVAGGHAICIDSNRESITLFTCDNYTGGSKELHKITLTGDNTRNGEPEFWPGVKQAAASTGQKILISGNFEDQIQINNVKATCLENDETNVDGYIRELDKTAVRFKARHYRLFKKLSELPDA